MKIIVAKNVGFCFGVERAVNMALSLANPAAPTYTYGELIHNEAVIRQLKDHCIYPNEQLDSLQEGAKLIIRSHGVSPDIYRQCEERRIALYDATCPFVQRIHHIVEAAKNEQKRILIAGQPDHPEVLGIQGWAGMNAHVVQDYSDINRLSAGETPAILVAQTTFDKQAYEAIIKRCRERFENIVCYDTICDTTVARQKEAELLAKSCTVMIVVGGRHSSNTKKMACICERYAKSTYSIENAGELLLEKIHSDDIIGIVAGASTPHWMIREVVTVMNELEKATVETQMETTSAQETIPVEAAITLEVEAPVQAPADVAEEAPSVTATQAEPPAEDKPAEEDAAAAATKEQDADSDNFAEALEKTMVRIRSSQIITGTVIQVVDDEVFVSIGYKSDGFIPKNEFSSDPAVVPGDVVKVGDSIEVEVLKVNDGEGNVLLSRKGVEGKKLWEELMANEDIENKVFEGVGKDVVKGGLIASINGLRAFVPASHVSIKYVENLSEFVGKPMRLAVIEVNRSQKRIVASQKKVMLAEQENAKKERWATLEAGTKVTGVVRRLTDFGAFVDIGGLDGLIHVTDIAWGRVKHPSDVLKIGQEIEVIMLNIDVEKKRVSLGYKQLQPKPWTMAAEKYPVGSIVEGKVVRIVPFGAFVALEPTIDGLIHISQVSVRRIAKVEDEINVGDIVRCKVLDVNAEAKRISLSRKDVILEENPEIAEEVAAERAERGRAYAERQEQRATERQQRTAKNAERANFLSPSSAEGVRPDRQERRPRRSEDSDYELPPVQSTTTSLASLFEGLTLTDEPEEAIALPVAAKEKPGKTPAKKAKAPVEEPAEKLAIAPAEAETAATPAEEESAKAPAAEEEEAVETSAADKE
ncbi:MAG: bifunctional 4-hydroxy-3-methylbut-2-enyl diphosphate reductase/30S ribosomal protein S1 [Clostridiales bacterium]|jgi:4-hydroxy-3-methylbut-2-enyl diphosphate reductase|nr:bifunctional 4-hydroxy-3-methylbut-2-enyl diphosphate reductase/30S ribosomal protein S1 [Clostridiales bacterium]